VKVVPVYSMKACGGVEVYLLSFLASALLGFEWSTSPPAAFARSSLRLGILVGPRTSAAWEKRRCVACAGNGILIARLEARSPDEVLSPNECCVKTVLVGTV
jgi:hypothetical protein